MPCQYAKERTETIFNESTLRDYYTLKLRAMSEEERLNITRLATKLIQKVKRKRPNMPFGIDSAYQLLFILGTFLNDYYPDCETKNDI